MDNVTQFLTTALIRLPMLTVYAVGILLATRFWRRCPRACLMTLLGCAVLIANLLGSSALQLWLFNVARPSGWSMPSLGYVLTAVSIASSLVSAGGFALLLAAVFSGRERVPELGA